ncbi:ribonuclease P protein component [Cyanobium sp. HWJ4-Hawea]|uniref:ribonuclease P protein component n=1 Tax=unclassified Cyanobium TaxID=2627006 RepID=UPI0020CD1AFD|nr:MULTISPECIES: ribonuclease P protein component [unclassified Cyanobium]MCP9774117.1 ribonuclease P protein component [Cyanobium sp. WAJ14-Wanaka]MCP9807864.1 ribonuclease P protein component [Cyanobium sp. HWJ4-Hawea]
MALPQRHRLKGQKVFDCLYQKGRKYNGPFLMLRLLEARPALLPLSQRQAPASPWRCGVVVSSKVHKRSVQRNRLRRLLHSHLLGLVGQEQQKALWLLISLKPGSAERESADLLGECNQLLQQAGLIP